MQQRTRRSYDAPLVLLCHCALSRPDAWFHRRFLAEWLSAHLSLEIPELDAAR
jgi:hypothetical protein